MIYEIIKPDYYDKFVCIADRCPMTCCQEWKIAVDDATNKKWKKLPPPAQTAPVYKSCSAYTARKDNGRVIQLNGHHQCPFLDEKQLCRLVLSYGDEMLSETCQIFPREIHDFAGRKEYSLMTCCPVVVDFLQEQDAIHFLQEQDSIHYLQQQKRERMTQQEEILADEKRLLRIRTLYIEILQNDERSIEFNLLIIFYIMLDFMDNENTLDDKISFWMQGENREDLCHGIEEIELNPLLTFAERNELFLDISVNYQREQMYQSCLSKKIMAAEQYEKHQDDREILSLLQRYKQIEKENEKLYRNFIIQEIYADLLIPGGDLEEMLVKLQWIAMEYAVMCHMNFLDWTEKQQNFKYEDIRENIIVICRMMGYEEEDIFEYLEEGFEELHWEWGYFALVTGKE